MSLDEMNTALPGVIVTGASGFVGRHFLEAAAGRFRLFCIARRSQFEAGVARRADLRWTQVDIGEREALLEVARCIEQHGGASVLLHLAGYYDFTYRDHEEYDRTNVQGTKNVLALAETVGVTHFIYSSSLAACRFPAADAVIDEDSAPDADFPYARSKRAAEAILCGYEGEMRRSIVRFAAIFSDWCEYPPVYAFLSTWLSRAWNARLLGGRGRSAVPYLHIRDLIALLLRLIEIADHLPRCGTYNASPNHVTAHADMFQTATTCLYGRAHRAFRIPRIPAYLGVVLRHALASLLRKPVFERPWMLRYVDRELRVDASRTQELLRWKPTPRYDILRRMLIMVENMKSHPELWRQRNEAALVHVALRPNLVLYTRLLGMREEVLDDVVTRIRAAQQLAALGDYERMTDETLSTFCALFFEILITAIRTKNRAPVRSYARMLAYHRRRQGFAREQVGAALTTFGRVIHDRFPAGARTEISLENLNEHIDLNLQLALDEIEEVYAQRERTGEDSAWPHEDVNLFSDDLEMQRLIDEINDICHDGWDFRAGSAM
jgi:nucleoside-diphosphate-sugar epimerase